LLLLLLLPQCGHHQAPHERQRGCCCYHAVRYRWMRWSKRYAWICVVQWF